MCSVGGPPPAPTPRPPDTSPDEQAKWDEDDQTARTLMHFSVKSSHIGVFQGAAEIAHAWWRQVLLVYDSRDLMLQTLVLRQFSALKMSESGTVDKHVLAFRN